ncbi:hypothetical protein GIB67_036424 [Kingdonia uniflora]|uniref:Fe2OG dioxygenase domain-containing protein n=1 Tax=Kingdonia uniflora TaxID=39325 RepID=A0A7J7L456_9MAGN|nr:hypothetical protein GIB67_036424 [Kingdonia uniflora]
MVEVDTGMECDRMEEPKVLDYSKNGVKGLVDSGITSIPKIFIYPSENLYDLKVAASCVEIPTIDLSNLYLESQRPKIVNQVKDASEKWGFFQIINHILPKQVMNGTMAAFKSCREQNNTVTYYNNQIPSNVAKAVNWKDSVRAFVEPWSGPECYDGIPSGCRKELMELVDSATRLADIVMELMSEGLGVEPGRLKELTCLESKKIRCHYYPYCPQPDLAMGLNPHTDKSVITFLMQNHVTGLQAKHDQEWVEVKPKDGGIIVNVGDLLQIISNDRYKSVQHRVVANSSRDPRISFGFFFNPGKNGEEDYYGPLPELVTPTKPALYRNYSMAEVRKVESISDSGIKELVNLFKL